MLSRGKDGPVPPEISPALANRMLGVWGEMQAELPRLSSNSLHVVARNSDHLMMRDVPDLVVAAVRAVVDASRKHSPLDSASLADVARADR